MAALAQSGMSAELLRDRRELTFYMSLLFAMMVCQIQLLPENYKANKWSDFAARFDLTYPVLFLQYVFPDFYLNNKRPIIALYSFLRSAITVPTWDIGWENVRPRNVLYLNLFLLLTEPIRSGTILVSDSAAFDVLRNILYCLPLLYTRGHVLAGSSIPLWVGLVPLYLLYGGVLPAALMGVARGKIRAERARLRPPPHGKNSYSSSIDVGAAASMKLDGLYPEDIHECSAEIESNLRAQLIHSGLFVPVAISIEAVRGCVLLAASVTMAGATLDQMESLSTLLKGLSMDQILPERIRERIRYQSFRSQAPALPEWAAGLVQHIAGRSGESGADACTLAFNEGSILLNNSPSSSIGGGPDGLLEFGLDLSVPGFDLSSLDTACLRGVLWASDGSWLVRPEPLVLPATWTRDPSSDAIHGRLTVAQCSIQPGEYGLTGLMAAVGVARSAEDDHLCGLLPLRAAAVAFSSTASAAAEQAAEHGGTALCADLGHLLHAARQRPLGAAALGGPWVTLSDKLIRYSTNARLGHLSRVLNKVGREVRRPRSWASDCLGFTDRALEAEYRPVFFGAVLKTNAMALLGGLPAVYGSRLKHGIWCGVIAYSIGFLALGGARVAGLHRTRPQLMSPLIAACQCLGHWNLVYSGKLYCELAGEINYGTVALLGYLGLFLYTLSFTNELPWAAVLSLSSQVIQTVTYFKLGCHSRHNDILFLIISDIMQTAGVLTALYVIYLRDKRMRGSFLRDRGGSKIRTGKAAPVPPALVPTSAKKLY